MCRKHIALIGIFLVTALSGCFTGVEGTKKITEKDVQKVIKNVTEEEKEASSLAIPVDSFVAWKPGKQFYVCDENAKLIFTASQEYDADTLQLKGRTLHYDGYYVGSVLDNRDVINVKLHDYLHSYVYSTGKTMNDINTYFTIPFLIDLDVVNFINGELKDKECYIKTSIWYGLNEQMIAGRKFVKVRIEEVVPGNKVFPIKVVFKDVEKDVRAMVWMTAGGTVLKTRSFDALFSLTDIRKKYPEITDDVWQCIVDGKVKEGMTKDEVRLSLGAPTSVQPRPTYSGVKEYWYYSNGMYLYFEDGVVVKL